MILRLRVMWNGCSRATGFARRFSPAAGRRAVRGQSPEGAGIGAATRNSGRALARAFVRRLRDTVLGGVEEEPSPANEESENVVRILTMHKAKGLEFPVVVLPDLAGRSSDSGAKLLFRRNGGCELRFAQPPHGGI